MRKLYLFTVVLMLGLGAWAQTITLTFTGRDAANHHAPLSRVIVTNITQNWQETLYGPDTVLHLTNGVGVNDFETERFKLSQNIPNPFTGTTDVQLEVSENEPINVEITDMGGRRVLFLNVSDVQAGAYTFRVQLATPQTYLLTARQAKNVASIKMVNNGTGGTEAIRLLDFAAGHPVVGAKSDEKGNVTHPWAYGDNLIIKGYSTICGTEYSKQLSCELLYSETIALDFDGQFTPPTVSNATATNITGNSVTLSATAGGNCGVTSRGFCYGTTQNPTLSGQHTTNGSGTGNFSANLSGLSAGTTYYVRAYATNVAGTEYGSEMSFPTGEFVCGETYMVDIDGNHYNTIQISNQCWMKENLRTTHYSDGTAIAYGSDTTSLVARRYYPGHNASNVSIFGYLYNWRAVMRNSNTSSANPSGVQGICPDGWHVPSMSEWEYLENYVREQPEYCCEGSKIAKSIASKTYWADDPYSGSCAITHNPNTNNATGFSILPSGRYLLYNYQDGLYSEAYFWSTTDCIEPSTYQSIGVNCFGLLSNLENPPHFIHYKAYGAAVRCVRNKGAEVSTNNFASSIRTNSAICGGTVTSDNGSPVTARGLCWSTVHYPTVADAHTTNGSGLGDFTDSITGLNDNTKYYVRAYAINSQGVEYGNEIHFTTMNLLDGHPCPGAATLTDIDNNTYNTVRIGNQCWMKENLRTTRYANGALIPFISDINNDTVTSMTVPYRYAPLGNIINNVPTYGYLYNWSAVMHGAVSSYSNPSGVQGICPTGWHVPSDPEWTQLTDYVKSQDAFKCEGNSDNYGKALASDTLWLSCNDGFGSDCSVCNNLSANNLSGFSIIPATCRMPGYLPQSPSFLSNYFGKYAYFSSSTEHLNVSSVVLGRKMSYSGGGLESLPSYETVKKNYGLSVRCIKD